MRWRTWVGLPVGVLGAVAGLLLWPVHGMRLPLQNLWAAPVAEATSPVVLLPFSQYAVATIAAVLVGVALAAPLVAPRVAGLIAGPTTLFDGPSWLLSVPRWLAPIGVGVAIAWSGLRTPGRIAASVLALLSLWVGPALVTASSGAVGIRVYATDPAAMLGSGGQVLGTALTAPELVLPPLLIAAVVAVVGLLVGGARSRRTTPAHP